MLIVKLIDEGIQPNYIALLFYMSLVKLLVNVFNVTRCPPGFLIELEGMVMIIPLHNKVKNRSSAI